MSNAIPPRPRFGSSKRLFVIVASQFNAHYVQGLVSHAIAEVGRLAPNTRTELLQVPGAFEIPIVVQEVASQKKADAIIALGLILKGQTDHAENLSRSVTEALQRIALEHGIPVLNGVLSVENEIQAQERCLGEQINRGTEAGRAAVEIAAVMDDLRA
ncbi:MAG TPA: 6,7-dimethyl-8-ribityllumazine synthase [Chthoniobacterales bacterium]|jgi:6,7-dimethyl-8-ribityllumazine synthase